MASDRVLLLDACCVINLVATGSAVEILQALPYDVAVASLVAKDEVLYVQGESDEEMDAEAPEGSGSREPAPPIEKFIDRGIIHVLDLEGEEEVSTYVDLALELDDGEAMTGALAIHRRGHLATDDRKAIRLLAPRLSPEGILRTSELVHAWAERGAPGAAVRRSLRRIQERARFVPPRDDPLVDWWRACVGDR